MMGYYPAAAGAQSTNPLEVEQHPESPRYESIFPDQVVPLDIRLSWKHRFLGNETFNQDEALPLTSPEFELQRTTARHGSEAPATSAVFDASGTVKQIRTSEGKIKIDHGPIERLGMPAMTMMFKVDNPEILVNLNRDMPVEFDVYNGPGGFEITRIRPLNSSLPRGRTVADAAGNCYSVGPFADKTGALAAARRIQRQGIEMRLESDSARVYIGDRVYVDGHTSRYWLHSSKVGKQERPDLAAVEGLEPGARVIPGKCRGGGNS